jgi:hypothetical protein
MPGWWWRSTNGSMAASPFLPGRQLVLLPAPDDPPQLLSRGPRYRLQSPHPPPIIDSFLADQ